MTKMVLAVALSLSVLSAPAADAAFTSKESGFSIQFPEKWERKEHVSGTVVTVLEPIPAGTKEAFRPNANVIEQDVPSDSDLKKFADGTLSAMSKLLKNYKELERKDITIGGLAAVSVLYTYTYEDVELKSRQVLAVSGKHSYVITCAADAAKFDASKPEFDGIVNSFRPL